MVTEDAKCYSERDIVADMNTYIKKQLRMLYIDTYYI